MSVQFHQNSIGGPYEDTFSHIGGSAHGGDSYTIGGGGSAHGGESFSSGGSLGESFSGGHQSSFSSGGAQTFTGVGQPFALPQQPSGSYLPSNGPQIHGPPQSSYGPPPSGQFLTPPSGQYGVPPGGKYQALAIQHGTVSGNLKPWPVNGSPPKQPISFQQPLPQGLIQSIGESVQQIDNLSGGYHASGGGSGSGYDFQQSHDLSGGLYSLPLAHAPQQFYQGSSISQNLQLPLEQTAYHSNHGSDCNHGIPQDSYGPPPSGGNPLGSGSEHSPNVISSYIPPPSGIIEDSNTAGSSNEHEVHEKLPDASERKSKAEIKAEISESNEKSNKDDQPASETQHSQSNFVIPVQGQHGSYQLQFQSANPLGGDGEIVDAQTHSQLLSEGLLQQILNAIEQPGQSNPIVPQASYDTHHNHHEVVDFIHSPTGQQTLTEPNKH